jgi:hypothetical protein
MTIPQTIAALSAAEPINTIVDVIRVMKQIDSSLDEQDGLKWFNLLYLKVTESVLNATFEWEDAVWLTRLDVVFAQLYFNHLWLPISRAWRPLLQARRRAGIAPIQFALAGMNAHINYDLPRAVVMACAERGVTPTEGTPQHRDFERVNALLEKVEGEVKDFLATGLVGQVDQKLGRVDDVIAIWKIRKARETAWNNAEVFWHLRNADLPHKLFDRNLANLVELSSRGLLLPVL